MKINDITGNLILRRHIGKGTYGDYKVALSSTDNALIIEIDNKMYSVDFFTIVEDVIKEKLK